MFGQPNQNRSVPESELGYDPMFLAALRYYLYERKWRPVDLHRATGGQVGKSTISAWLNEKSRPTLSAVERVCKALGVTVADFWLMGQKIIDDEQRRRRAEQRAAEQREIELAEDVDVLLRKIRSMPPEDIARLRAEIDAILEAQSGEDEDGAEDPGSLVV